MPRRRRRSGWWRRLVIGFWLLVIAVPLAIAAVIWRTIPSDDMELRIAGLSSPVTIALDEVGIPRIRARTERDAAIALGFLHARDRLFQMEMMRRGAQGRLSEIAGSATLRNDRFVRLLGLARRAEADFAALDADTRGMLEAYAIGVNAWIAERGRFAAPEFLALGAPEFWQPSHSLLWAKVMGLWLSNNWRSELERARLAGALPADRLWDLWPADQSAGRPDVAALSGLDRMLAAIPVFGEDAPLPDTASNAWAVARGAAGAPLLASDPHLGYGAPILWYLARIELPDGRFVAGGTVPGVPLVLIGRNADLAWGFTTTHSDTQDVFREPESAARVVRTEVIHVRGEPDVTMEVRETANGPVISDLDEMPRGDGEVLAVHMANLEPNDTAAAGFLALNRGRSIADARAAAALITSPPQNMMVADRSGGIALYLTGRTPLRGAGDGSVPGSVPWAGFVPFDELPHVENPEGGLLVNANNRVSPPDHPAFLSREWFGDWRFRRIHQLLAEPAPRDEGRFAAIQMDAVSLLAREALPVLNALPRGTGALGVAQGLLADWDGETRADLPQPLIWNAFLRRMPALALRRAGIRNAPGGPEFLRFLLLDANAGWWCGGDCRAMAALALAEAVAELAQSHGADPTAWRWGAAHRALFEHPLLRLVPGLNRAIELAVPASGDDQTVQRQGPRGGGGFGAVHGAGLRMVADLSTPDGIYAVIATGQSGHPLSSHWGDLLGSWHEGRLRQIPREPAETTGRIRLAP
ncbi:penicillin acylase family protein [Roseococcus sp. SYP-B2431]|uniref:penicillin acylase family protein n=1 Tax=Roseococcus sp. SYP-B2431 TaxID=2496640 RepID=UPI00103D2E71|nr:penicillin acylase family protein [Roseococcus sp. SYP-B2431]TCI00323.1 penicillin acylase family protein [Roseococcus sp. SYP-B2431]